MHARTQMQTSACKYLYWRARARAHTHTGARLSRVWSGIAKLYVLQMCCESINTQDGYFFHVVSLFVNDVYYHCRWCVLPFCCCCLYRRRQHRQLFLLLPETWTDLGSMTIKLLLLLFHSDSGLFPWEVWVGFPAEVTS